MNTEQQSLKTGAPLRVLALIFGCWMISRLAWGHFSDVADTENVLASPSTQTYQSVNVVAVDEPPNVDKIGLKKAKSYCSILGIWSSYSSDSNSRNSSAWGF